jgi:hypothetical protein
MELKSIAFAVGMLLMGELNPTTTVAIFAFLAIVVPAFITDRRAAKRDAAQAAVLAAAAAAAVERDEKAAKLVAGVALKAEEAAALVADVAVKTEEVKTHLVASDTKTNGKLDVIHDLVNNKMSEQLKRTKMIADALLATNPDNAQFQEIARQAETDVQAHKPAESTTREAKNG